MATGRIGTTPVLQVRWSKAPSAGTTSLSGLDDNSVSLVYSVGYEAVYRNGVLLSRTNDYTATDGTTVTLIDATITGDIIEIFANQTIPLSDTYSQTVANGKFINNTLTTTTGDIIYASAANTPARLAIGSTDQVLKVSGGIPAWGAAPTASFSGCVATKAVGGSQTISNSTATLITFTVEAFDTNNYHDNSTNTSRMTVPFAGYYEMVYSIVFASNGTGYRDIRFLKNGTQILRNLWNVDPYVFKGSFISSAAANDYFEIQVFQNSGGNLNITNDYVYDTNFQIKYLGV